MPAAPPGLQGLQCRLPQPRRRHGRGDRARVRDLRTGVV